MRQFSLGDMIEQTSGLWVDGCGNLHESGNLYTALSATQRAVPVRWDQLEVAGEAIFPVLVDGAGRPWVARVDTVSAEGLDDAARQQRHQRVGEALKSKAGRNSASDCFPPIRDETQ